MRRPKAPDVVFFGFLKRPGDQFGPALCYYEILGFRPPMKGEYYLSGAIVEAYRAPNNLNERYWVVKPTHYAVPTHGFIRGDAV